ncbi:MAG: elongation factor 4 [Spirochaetes bacterium]|nr:elongation factor 4 [Spirochaetota bacterium]
MKNIRNFSIIAHIDHGKSTLADRLLELTHIKAKGGHSLVLDDMDLEKERGITIKSHAVRMNYHYNDQNYILNLIDTPGHMDFGYEVSRSLAACEGAILLVDAAQGVEAQTIVNYNIAFDNQLEIIGVINKIDLPSADVPKVKEEMEHTLLIPKEEIISVSAKSGLGVEALLNRIVEKIPSPKGDPLQPLRALIIDSYYDSFRGVILKVRIFDGDVKGSDRIIFMSSKQSYEVSEVGYYILGYKKCNVLSTGDVGYIVAGIKQISDVSIGDTITLSKRPAPSPLKGFRKVKPMVFAGIYPVEGNKYDDLKTAIEKLKLNDAALSSLPDNSQALGLGFRCGFLGLLHLEIVQERLEREFDVDLVITAPNVSYKLHVQGGQTQEITNPSDFPIGKKIDKIEEPFVQALIVTPSEYIGNIMKLMQEYRGEYQKTEYINPTRVELVYDIPLSEIIFDFLDRLKSVSRGFASFDYEMTGFRASHLVKVDILIHKKTVDALSIITHREKAYYQAKKIVEKLKKVIPRQLFEVAIQAAVGSKVIARESIPPLRKDVIAKCYGGDITRKRKLLEKQKEGKKRMKRIGNVDIPQEAFLSILKVK